MKVQTPIPVFLMVFAAYLLTMTMKKPDLARKELPFDLAISVDALPEYKPEIRISKRPAGALMKKYIGDE